MALSYQEKNACVPGDILGDEKKLLQDCGITRFVFSQKLRMHAKIIVVDGARAFLGSENLTANSLDNNRELGILLDDAGIVGQLASIAQKDFTNP